MDKSVKRKTAVITGAASGIGAATVDLFLDAGISVLGIDINAPKRVKSPFRRHDLAKKQFQCPFDYVDDLIICHGVSGVGRTWEEVLAVNVLGVRNAVESCLSKMSPKSSILMVASMTGFNVGNKDMSISNYAASKGAVVGYMRQLSVELAPLGIRVNAVCPGPVETPMTAALKERDPDFYEEFFGRCLLPGKTQASDIAAAIFAVTYTMKRMTGQTLVIDGGYTAW